MGQSATFELEKLHNNKMFMYLQEQLNLGDYNTMIDNALLSDHIDLADLQSIDSRLLDESVNDDDQHLVVELSQSLGDDEFSFSFSEEFGVDISEEEIQELLASEDQAGAPESGDVVGVAATAAADGAAETAEADQETAESSVRPEDLETPPRVETTGSGEASQGQDADQEEVHSSEEHPGVEIGSSFES